MKKFIVIIAVAMFGLSFGQETKFGVKAGANLANANVEFDNKSADTSNLFGFYLGGFATIKFADQFAFQPELLLSMEGTKLEESSTGYEYVEKDKFTMINVPLMLKWFPVADSGFNVEFGPQIGFVASAKYELEETILGVTTTEDGDIEDFKSLNLSLNAGLAYELENGLGFNARYNIGLSDLYDGNDSGASYKLNNISLGLSYTFKK